MPPWRRSPGARKRTGHAASVRVSSDSAQSKRIRRGIWRILHAVCSVAPSAMRGGCGRCWSNHFIGARLAIRSGMYDSATSSPDLQPAPQCVRFRTDAGEPSSLDSEPTCRFHAWPIRARASRTSKRLLPPKRRGFGGMVWSARGLNGTPDMPPPVRLKDLTWQLSRGSFLD
jgi:hypothetical protein